MIVFCAIIKKPVNIQMTNYQEQLTQMQHDLESGLEAMAENMANTGGDTVVRQIHWIFTSYVKKRLTAQLDIDGIFLCWKLEPNGI